MVFDQFSEPKSLVELAHRNQTCVGSYPRPLKSDLQKAVERRLKWLFLALTHWVSTSGDPS